MPAGDCAGLTLAHRNVCTLDALLAMASKRLERDAMSPLDCATDADERRWCDVVRAAGGMRSPLVSAEVASVLSARVKHASRWRLSDNERALLEIELAVAAPRFVGNLISTFVFTVYERRALQGKASFCYNSRLKPWLPDPLFDQCNDASATELCAMQRRMHLDGCADLPEVADDIKSCWTYVMSGTK